jgi:ubiquinone/menaquinone biosynthesis C-methylase UbiE
MELRNPDSINRATYDRIARHFSEMNAAMPPPLIEPGKQFVKLLPPGNSYLDLGCGHGRDIAYLDGLGGYGIGVDLSRGMLEQAQRTCGSPLA